MPAQSHAGTGCSGLRLLWTEKGGPPVAGPPDRRGFGSRLLRTLTEQQLGGRLALDWEPDGLRLAVRVPLAACTRTALSTCAPNVSPGP